MIFLLILYKYISYNKVTSKFLMNCVNFNPYLKEDNSI